MASNSRRTPTERVGRPLSGPKGRWAPVPTIRPVGTRSGLWAFRVISAVSVGVADVPVSPASRAVRDGVRIDTLGCRMVGAIGSPPGAPTQLPTRQIKIEVGACTTNLHKWVGCRCMPRSPVTPLTAHATPVSSRDRGRPRTGHAGAFLEVNAPDPQVRWSLPVLRVPSNRSRSIDHSLLACAREATVRVRPRDLGHCSGPAWKVPGVSPEAAEKGLGTEGGSLSADRVAYRQRATRVAAGAELGVKATATL